MDNTELIARGLTHLIWRNGAVETLHSNLATLDDETMKVLNKDVYNRIYSLLTMEPEKAHKLAVLYGFWFGQDWDEPEVVEFGDFPLKPPVAQNDSTD